MDVMETEVKENKEALTLLENIKKWFSKKEIERIRVCTAKQTFWVSNPKKIEFWKALAANQAGFVLKRPEATLGTKITKVVYKE